MPTQSYGNKTIQRFYCKKNTTQVDFNDKKLDNVRFGKFNSMPAVREHFTPKNYVDQAVFQYVNEPSFLRLEPDEKIKLDEQDSIILSSTLTSLKAIIELPTKSYVDSLHESNRSRRDISSVFNDQSNEFENKKLSKLDNVTVKRNPSSYNEVANKETLMIH